MGLRLVLQPHPPCPPDAIRVPQAEGLPPASFRFHLTMDTFALGYALPAAGRARDFHPLGMCHARHTETYPQVLLDGMDQSFAFTVISQPVTLTRVVSGKLFTPLKMLSFAILRQQALAVTPDVKGALNHAHRERLAKTARAGEQSDLVSRIVHELVEEFGLIDIAAAVPAELIEAIAANNTLTPIADTHVTDIILACGNSFITTVIAGGHVIVPFVLIHSFIRRF